MTAEKPLVSIICPVFNEEPSIDPFYARLTPVLTPLRDRYRFELIFTNNCSTDDTASKVLGLREKNPEVQLLSLSRNFGYQGSIHAGLRQASGAAVIIIDVDCEDPPELIPKFVDGWNEGNDLVYGLRGRRHEFWGVTVMRKIF